MDEIKAKLQQLWNGDVPLVQTFWLYYFLGIIFLRMLAHLLGLFGGLFILGWAGFLVVPIWRAADKYQGEDIFAILAKIAAVLIALSAIGSLL